LFPDILNEVREIMVTEVVTITPDQSITEAAKLMEEKGIGSVIVVENNKAVGIITERDFLRLAAAGYDVKTTKVRDGMTKPPVVCEPSMKIADAYVLMRNRRVRHLPVVGRNGELVGIVGFRDLITHGRLIL